MVRHYSTDNATLSFMQITQSSGIFYFLKIVSYVVLQDRINNLQKYINSTIISISMVSADT